MYKRDGYHGSGCFPCIACLLPFLSLIGVLFELTDLLGRWPILTILSNEAYHILGHFV
jgi:hypothetical protein